MSRAFKLPDLGEGIHEGEIVAVLVSPGEEVSEGTPILEVETDKAAVEIPSPFDGVVESVDVKPNDLVKVGTVLMTFSDGGQQAAGRHPEPAAPKRAQSAPATPASAPGSGRPGNGGDGHGEPVPASPATRRLARELGVDLREVGGSGPAGLVTAEDVRLFAEQAVAARGAGEAAAEQPAHAAPETEAVETPPSVAPSPAAPALPDFARWGEVERVPLRSVRRATARHMALAWSQVPHVNHQDIADITRLEAYRKEHKAEVEALGGQLTMTVFIVKAVVAALKTFPRFNSSLDTASEEIVLKRYYHIGVATDTERGLVVPVLRNADKPSIVELSTELRRLAERARAGEMSLEELQGGTFTVTNIGALGGTGFSPIVNYPEVAILGLGRARLQPVIVGDMDNYQVVPRLMMPMVLAFDHRVLDGADAARFINLVIELLENPDKLWLRA